MFVVSRFGVGRIVLALVTGVVLVVPACSSDESGGGQTANPGFGGKKVSATIGPEGGTLTSSDGNVVVVIPAGALSQPTALYIAPAPDALPGAHAAVELGPEGTAFQLPAQISIAFGSLAFDKFDFSTLRLGTVVGGKWQTVPGSSVNTTTKKVFGQASHFSPWGVLSDSGGPAPDAGPCVQNMCAQGCGCDPVFAGASCKMGLDGTPGCIACSCDGSSFSCTSCAGASDAGSDGSSDSGGDSGGDGGGDAGSDSGSGPTCKATQSCDQKSMNQSCQEYDATTPAATVQGICVGGTYSAAPCDRTASLGGCEDSSASCSVVWYFPGINPWTVADIQQKCLNNGKKYVAP